MIYEHWIQFLKNLGFTAPAYIRSDADGIFCEERIPMSWHGLAACGIRFALETGCISRRKALMILTPMSTVFLGNLEGSFAEID